MRAQHSVAKVRPTFLAFLLVLASFPTTAAETFGEAFTQGDFSYGFRWRLENVDQDPLPHDATAIPLRARINFTTSELNGITFKAELDYVFDFGVDEFNAGGGNKPAPPGYPVIADPGGEDLNQLYAQYKASSGTLFRLGRQRIIYDNARFIGNVGWRQNEQTYDAFSIGHATKSGVNFQYAYLDNVNRIFGDEVNAGDHSQNTHLLNVDYAFEGFGKLSAYYYDIDNEDAVELSNTTMGLRFNGSVGNDGPKIDYGLEYARQSENADNPTSYSADYWRLDISLGFSPATLYGGYESLGGDSAKAGQAFRTPLATLHAFNGWADKFLNTPDAGLNDLFVGVKGKLGNWNWNAIYHDFSAQSGSGSFGTEIDASIARKFAETYSVLFKTAQFNTDSIAYGDTTKYWIQLTADF